ncbi:hypothetical protein L6452_00042 [Arctium lappa]|uniref:Uncharacterized protein n=1 Tax=Arctium lappa TaxID=4217 RepID=A0ACB9FDL7_ARCLA|nr:hypothetical protein L6452_00042 [Arctium lappa]
MSTKSLKSKKPPSPPQQNASRSSSLSSHLAMIELKHRILTSLSKLSDRDTHQIAVEDLEKIIQTLSPDGITMLLNSLYEATNDNNKTAVKKEAIRLLFFLCATHTESAASHLTKIIAHIVKRLKDSDSGVKDACRESIGQLSCLYLKGEGVENIGSVVALFVKPLFEALNDQNKGVQAGSAMCMAKMVEMASDPPISAFQKLCTRICKYLNNPNFLAKAALLQVVSSLSQVGAISPQGLEPLLQSIHDCLSNSDWATRKAAADALNALALHSSNLITGKTSSTITALEACRFDKIKPARDSIIEALQQWQGLAGGSEDQKTPGHDSEPAKSDDKKTEAPAKDDEAEGSNVPEKAVGMLKKKAPALSDKELNPEFFQRLERRVSGDVEVVVPRRFVKSTNEQNEEESGLNDTDAGSQSKESYQKVDRGVGGPSRRREFDDMNDPSQREGLRSNKGNWLAIQRQLLQLERQQAHLMNMLQDFMGGSHDGMLTLENRVRGLERVVEDMARDLSIAANNRRGGNYMMGFEESGRQLGKYNGFSDYPNTKLGRNDDGVSYMGSSMRGRGSSWRSDVPESWDYHAYGRNTQMGLRRAAMDGRSPKSDNGGEQVNRRGWGDKGGGPARFGEGPSARSVWQASKDEATLEAIRVAGEDNGPIRTARVAVPEMTAEAMGDDNLVQDRDPVWTAWTNAMDALHVGDIDTAFAEVLSTGDDLLLVKLMDRTGTVIDQLSSEVGTEVLQAVAQFLPDPNLFDICLSWLQQLLDMIVESGTDIVGIPMEVKREILLNLNEASSTIEPPEDWEGMVPDQLLLQLASAWDIDLQQLEK